MGSPLPRVKLFWVKFSPQWDTANVRDSTVGAAKSLAAACMGMAAGDGGRPDWLQLKDARGGGIVSGCGSDSFYLRRN